MKRSLLLISAFCILCLGTSGQELAKPGTKPQTQGKAHKGKAATAKNSRKGKAHKHIKNTKNKEIIHVGPDQQRVDSIKAEKMKQKK